MGLAQPISKLFPRLSLDRTLFLDIVLEVFGADPARVQAREGAYEGTEVGALGGRGAGWVGGRYGVEKGPGRRAEGGDVGRAVAWYLSLRSGGGYAL